MDQNTCNINQKEFEETLSLCDLALENYQDLDDHQSSLSFDHQSPNSLSHHHHQHFDFEFPFIPKYTPLNSKNGILFCGKLIKEKGFDDDDDNDDGINDQNMYLFPPSSPKLFKNNKDLGSLYSVNKKPNSSLSTKSFRSQSRSASAKHKVLIGLVKIPPKMELSDIKKRQSRRNPSSSMLPPLAESDPKVVSTTNGCGGGGRRGHQWSQLLRPSWCRAHISSALAKATLGCIPHV